MSEKCVDSWLTQYQNSSNTLLCVLLSEKVLPSDCGGIANCFRDWKRAKTSNPQKRTLC